ncbi:MAG: hypothetical protein ACF8XB_08680 [Planctomycetota bacterium JB042]
MIGPRTTSSLRVPAFLLLVAAGCSDASKEPSSSSSSAAIPERYWLTQPPAAPSSVFEARERAGSAEPAEVVVAGRVSGLVDGRAQLRLTDASFTPCDERPGDSCRTPWDYCCEPPDELARGTVVVEVHEDGRLAKASVAGFHGLELLSEVVVTGTATRDEAGNVTVVATGIHVAGA